MSRFSFTLALVLTGCAGSLQTDYTLTPIGLPGSEGAALDPENERVYTGMNESVCEVVDDEIIDTFFDDSLTRVEVLDARDGAVLFADDVFQVVDVATGVAEVVPVEEPHRVADIVFHGDAIAVLHDTTVRFVGGAEVPLPDDNYDELVSGDTLMARAGLRVFDVGGAEVTRVADAHDLAWDAASGLWYFAHGDTLTAFDNGVPRWRYTHDRHIVDVFPFDGHAGLRDDDGVVHRMTAGGRRAESVLTLGTDGHVLGTVDADSLAVFRDGLYILELP